MHHWMHLRGENLSFFDVRGWCKQHTIHARNEMGDEPPTADQRRSSSDEKEHLPQ